MIRKFKFFFNPIDGLTKWLNKMSDKGYRLIKVDNTFFYFEECERGKYRYAVDYVANRSYESLNDYERFLKGSNIRYIEKPGSVGKISFGNIRWRPYADKGGKLATSKGMIKKEFLILEKGNDGPFEIYTNIKDQINALEIMRKPTISMLIFIGVMMIVVNFGSQSGSSFLNAETNKLISLIVLGIAEILLVINLLRFNLKIRKLKKDSNINE
ncbi:DUF2812 domain-containing protein [Acidilutibacter cellobiosedens]|mgnify:CR=1 FL=1|jgi:hypothetical protein|uniref:DUF2812 domain-containing protein n=1 Tax=Acidilutibacter cellobiosedens TaxID=2507161 RepID=A0A410Q917_9FIRM|nr:DUF2812 domain-containing protein [Acidilutibacter cellobiosedens]MBE6083384.1 DUF2812 domain-containing protein [Tissierellaceae bacterium]QAT60485.1 DUF2812 domain-containing protein [Acidilutibacter cellobiosedens]